MRLLYFKYYNHSHEHPLNGFEHSFREFDFLEDDLNPICFVGVNGSGKSKLLECIAHTFGYLFNQYSQLYARGPYTDSQIEFKLGYSQRIKGKWRYIEIEKDRNASLPLFKVGTSEENLTVTKADPIELLPRSVIGYTSGDNESLSDWFTPYSDQYAEYYMASAFRKETKIVLPEFPNMVWIDYSINSLVFIANSLLNRSPKWLAIENEVKLNGLRSFRIIIRLNPKDGPSMGIKAAPDQAKIIELIESCCTTFEKNENDQVQIFDFYVSDATRKIFKDKFKTAYNLFLNLLQLNLLNHVIIRSQLEEMRKFERNFNERIDRPDVISTRRAFTLSQIKVFLKGSAEVVDYGDLSDGEHQLLQVFGTLAMVDDDNCLFLMDEPETHFNPQWRAAFISLMARVIGKRFQEYLITTHSPFLLSDSKSENVLIFERPKSEITIRQPEIQTYGAAIDRLLKIAFNVAPPVAFKSRDELKNLIANKSKSIKSLENEALKFGDSIQKLYLYQKIEELKKKKINKHKRKKTQK